MRADPAGDADQVRSFYERYAEEHVPYQRSPAGWKRLILRWLPYASYREWRFWERWVPANCRLLDLGCARGRETFRSRARLAAGIDLAKNALRDCAQHYDLAALGELTDLPFADSSFDCVVSSHVLGHIPAQDKDRALAEATRVLRPGGLSLHVIETDATHPLIELARRWPESYRRWLIDQDGHVGLESPAAVIERFRRAGCRLHALETIDAGPLHPRLVVKWFDNEYVDSDPRFRLAATRARRILGSPWRLAVEEIRLGARHRWLAQRRDPLERAPFIAAVFVKSR